MAIARTMRMGMLALAVVGVMAGCDSSPAPMSKVDADNLDVQVQGTVEDFMGTDGAMKRFFDGAYAYAVFPAVTSGALVVGGAHGEGEVFVGKKLVGYADMAQGSFGAQIGGQRFAEVIFFQTEAAFVDFKASRLEFDARATAVAAAAGAATTADYQRGVAVFTLPQGGLMAQAAVGGQKFKYEAK